MSARKSLKVCWINDDDDLRWGACVCIRMLCSIWDMPYAIITEQDEGMHSKQHAMWPFVPSTADHSIEFLQIKSICLKIVNLWTFHSFNLHSMCMCWLKSNCACFQPIIFATI